MMPIALLCVATLAMGFVPQSDLEAETNLYEHGSYLQAARLLAAHCTGQADCGDAGILLARSYLKLRRWDDAIHVLEKEVKKSPANARCHLWLGRAYGSKAEHVSPLSALSLAHKVGREFETAAKLDPESVDIRFDLMQYDLEAPGILGGGRDKALAQVEAIDKLDGRLGYTAKAIVHEHDKEWQKAEDDLTRSTLIFPDKPEAFGDLAQYLLRRKRYAEAEAAAAKALALRPRYPHALLVQAASRIMQGKDLAAVEQSLRELAAGPLRDDDPSFQEVFYWLGMACLARGKQPEAREAFITALQFDPEHTGAKSALSQIRSAS